MDFWIAVLGTDSENNWKFGKMEHENGLKTGQSFLRKILM